MRRYLGMVLAVFLILFPAAGSAGLPSWEGWWSDAGARGVTGVTQDGWEYQVNNQTGTAVVNGYQGSAAEVIVPAVVDGYKVDVIMSGAFNSGMIGISVSNGILALDEPLFYECTQLLSLTLPSSLTYISPDAFMDAPSGLVIYGYSGSLAEEAALKNGFVFIALDKGETVLRGITQDGFSYLVKDGEATITGYHGTASAVTLPQTAGGSPVRYVGRDAFRNTPLEEIHVPEGVVSIGPLAFFSAMQLKNITLPKSLRRIGENGLGSCDALTSLTLPEGLVSLGDNAVSQLNSLQSITIPSTLREAGVGALSYLPVSQIVLPEGMTEISDWLLFECDITSFTVPQTVTSIGEYAFFGCRQLKEITIPAGVTRIDPTAFQQVPPGFTIYGYSGTEAETAAKNGGYIFVDLGSGQPVSGGITNDGYTYVIQSNGEGMITGYQGTDHVLSIPARVNGAQVTSIGQSMLYNRDDIAEVNLPSGIVSIGNNAFDGCFNMTRITLPPTLKNLGSFALANCEGLTALDLPDGLVRIGREAISQCTSLASVTVPGTLREIGYGAFSNSPCNTLTTLPRGITELSDYLFWGCGFSSFTIPNGVTSIGDDAFAGCPNLKYIIVPESVTDFGENVINPEFGTPNPVLYGYMGSAAESYARKAKLTFIPLDTPASVLRLPGHLKVLEQTALSSTGAEAVFVPASCEKVESKAFEQCLNLRMVHFAGMETQIAQDAFDGCGDIIIYGHKGSTAQTFAKAKAYVWVEE